MARKDKWSFIHDNPFLPKEDAARANFFKLIQMVYFIELAGGPGEPFSTPIDFGEETTQLKTSLKCVNCNKEIDHAALYLTLPRFVGHRVKTIIDSGRRCVHGRAETSL
jgi:hypothetical protein